MSPQDWLQTLAHLAEHKYASIYKSTHKPHHRFLNPRLFDAFDGSFGDTVCMILIPLFITAHVVHCNVCLLAYQLGIVAVAQGLFFSCAPPLVYAGLGVVLHGLWDHLCKLSVPYSQ